MVSHHKYDDKKWKRMKASVFFSCHMDNAAEVKS